MESLVKVVQQSEFELYPPSSEPPAHSLMHWAQWIIPEERVIPRYPDSFRLEAPYRYALEKWKAVILYNSQQEHGANFKPEIPPHLSTPEQLYYGTDGRSLYLSKETRDMRGLTKDGEEAEISAADCQDVSLTEVLKKVEEIRGAISLRKKVLRLAKESEARTHAENCAVKEEPAHKEESTVKEESTLKEESAINSK